MNKRKTRTAAHDVVDFQLLPANNGFWLETQSSRVVHFELEFFALGVASYQRRGDVRGKTDQPRFRQFIDLGFDVMLVGITSAKFSAGKPVKGRAFEVLEGSLRDSHFKPIRPSGLLARGGSRSEIVISKRGRRRRDQGGPYAGPYAGPYWAYGEYMYQPGPSVILPSRREPRKAKKKNRNKTKGRRRKR